MIPDIATVTMELIEAKKMMEINEGNEELKEDQQCNFFSASPKVVKQASD